MFNRNVEKIKESVKLYFQPLIEAWTKPTAFVEQAPKRSKSYEELRKELEEWKVEFSSELVQFAEEDPKLSDDGYWAFEMYTPDYICDGEFEPKQHDCIIELNDTTWMEVLDQILDVMGKHYGYNIKEQVYYSVVLPYNIEGEAGYGRCLNDDVLQQMLLTYPEVYDVKGRVE